MTTLSFRKPAPSVFVYGSLSVNFNLSCSPLDSVQFVSTTFEDVTQPEQISPSLVFQVQLHMLLLQITHKNMHIDVQRNVYSFLLQYQVTGVSELTSASQVCIGDSRAN